MPSQPPENSEGTPSKYHQYVYVEVVSYREKSDYSGICKVGAAAEFD